VYLAGETGTGGQFLAWLSPDGSTERISQREIRYQVDTFPSPDGTRIAAELENDSAIAVSVHIHEIARDISAPLVPGSESSFPVWSPDSQHVAYFLDEAGVSGVYRAPIDRSTLPTLLLAKPDDAYILPTHWSPDGSTLLYVRASDITRSTGGEFADLWLLPLDGTEPQPFLVTDAREVDGRFSPDGRWIAYESDQSGSAQVYVRALAGGGEYQISANSGVSPEWNVTGGKLYFYDGPELVEVDIDVSGATPVVSTERTLVDMRGRFRNQLFAPAPDGERFLVAEFAADADRSIRAIFNWDLLREWR
jgi:Tol biopolymer transport system component